MEPYQISGSNSFALRLYIDTLGVVFQCLQGSITIPGFIPSILRYRFRYEKKDKIMELIGIQLQNMKIDERNTNTYCQTNEPLVESIGHPVMSKSDYENLGLAPLIVEIAEDATKDGISISSWLDPWNTQKYLTERWGMTLSATSVNIPNHTIQLLLNIPHMPEGTSSSMKNSDNITRDTNEIDISRSPIWQSSSRETFPRSRNYSSKETARLSKIPQLTSFRMGRHSEGLVLNSTSLVKKLSIYGVCFAEGPRFEKNQIDEAVLGLLQDLTI
jgi:hypothetical protein